MTTRFDELIIPALFDVGDAGHIDAEAGLEDWPDGITPLDRLRLDRSERATAPTAGRLPDRPVAGARGRRA